MVVIGPIHRMPEGCLPWVSPRYRKPATSSNRARERLASDITERHLGVFQPQFRCRGVQVNVESEWATGQKFTLAQREYSAHTSVGSLGVGGLNCVAMRCATAQDGLFGNLVAVDECHT